MIANTERITALALSRRLSAGLIATFAFLVGCQPVEDPSLFAEVSQRPTSKVAHKPEESNPLNNVYFGDLHIHTSYSTDAFTMGVRGLPDDAYYYAKGEAIEHPLGFPIQMRQPLDFAAVTDHAEYLGVLRAMDPPMILKDRSMRERLLEDGPLLNTLTFLRIATFFSLGDVDAAEATPISKATWAATIDSAERHNEPGRFAAFIGYEWSSMPNDQNLHRNVIYRSNNVPELPYSSLESKDPRDLWSRLENERARGMDNLAIPHNGNLSDGRMYSQNTFAGEPIGTEYAARRIQNEPISELFQVKGASETHPTLSPDDPFADFDIVNQMLSNETRDSEPRGSYVRDALKTGLSLERKVGFNPYQFGVIGASDGHTASSPVEEDNYTGKLPLLDGSAAIRMGEAYLLLDERNPSSEWGAAGVAAVWAPQNTREALFDAMRRKETYATSGPRITLRFFAGAEFDTELLEQAEWVAAAYELGVPMGGELVAPEDSPEFVVAASKDPLGANLDRIQIIKGWIDSQGTTHEKIYDVALSPNRDSTDPNSVPETVGNTVNKADASYTNTIGSAQLSARWTDPDYEPSQSAFYYARVIEIPTPRWSTYDAKTLGIEAPEPSSHQERAVSSAIWVKTGNAP